jgi:hypothetical protein
MQVPDADMGRFQAFLDVLGYQHHNESNDPAYKRFLT